MEASENLIFWFKLLSRVRTVRPKFGVFSKMFKIQFFCFITQLVKKSICLSVSHILFVPGGQTFLTHRRGGDKHFLFEAVAAIMMLMKK